MLFSNRTNPMCTVMQILAVLVITLIATSYAAQAQDPEQNQIRNQERQQLREQIRQGIEQETELTASERQAMLENLDSCLQLGLSASEITTLFPQEGEQPRFTVRSQLRFQNRVLASAREDLPVEPLIAKIQEGQVKGVPEPALEQACERMTNQLRYAHRIMTQAREGGVESPDDPVQEQRMTQEMAQQMWRGMSEEGLEHLCEQARIRTRTGQCTLEDLTSASETATRFHEEGIPTDRAVQVVGEALQQGYRAQQMQQFRLMVMARHQHGGPVENFLADMEFCLDQGMGAGEMYRHMWQNGWMGPGDMHGPGGPHNIDDVGRGGPGHHGGTGGSGEQENQSNNGHRNNRG